MIAASEAVVRRTVSEPTCSYASTRQLHPALIAGLENSLHRRWRLERTQVCEQRAPKNLRVLQTGIGAARSAILQEQEPTPGCAVLAKGVRNAEVLSQARPPQARWAGGRCPSLVLGTSRSTEVSQIYGAFRTLLNVGRTSSKTLKGSWTHCPDDKSLANVVRRLQLCRALCDEVDVLPLPNSIFFR